MANKKKKKRDYGFSYNDVKKAVNERITRYKEAQKRNPLSYRETKRQVDEQTYANAAIRKDINATTKYNEKMKKEAAKKGLDPEAAARWMAKNRAKAKGKPSVTITATRRRKVAPKKPNVVGVSPGARAPKPVPPASLRTSAAVRLRNARRKRL